MRNIVKRILIATLFAVAMLGGGELPILPAPQFAEAHAFVHEHMGDAAHTHEHATDKAAHDAGDQGDQQSPGADHTCTHVHAHCCAATAILVSASMPAPLTAAGQLRLDRYGAIPYGQLSNPPLRPPRLIV